MASTTDADISSASSASASPEHELKREAAYPQYMPATGVGSKMRGGNAGGSVIVDGGAEHTRENTPVSSSVSTPAVPSNTVDGSAPGVTAPRAPAPTAATAGGNVNNGQQTETELSTASTTSTASSERAAANRQSTGEMHDIHHSDAAGAAPPPSAAHTDQKQDQASRQASQSHPSYFPPFNSASASNASTTTSSNGTSKPTFPSTLLSSRDKSSLLGHVTPPHRTLFLSSS